MRASGTYALRPQGLRTLNIHDEKTHDEAAKQLRRALQSVQGDRVLSPQMIHAKSGLSALSAVLPSQTAEALRWPCPAVS